MHSACQMSCVLPKCVGLDGQGRAWMGAQVSRAHTCHGLGRVKFGNRHVGRCPPRHAAIPTPHSGYHFDGSDRRFFEGWYFKVLCCRRVTCAEVGNRLTHVQ